MNFILVDSAQVGAGISAEDFVATRMLLKFAPGTKSCIGEKRQYRGTEFMVYFGVAKNASGQEVECQISDRAVKAAREKQLVTDGAIGLVINVAGTVGSDGWYQTEELKAAKFDRQAVKSALAGTTANTANTTTAVTNDAGW